MAPEAFREFIAEATFPLMIQTRGGETYSVSGPHSLWLPPEYPSTVFVARTGRGVALLSIDAVDSIHPEHEFAGR